MSESTQVIPIEAPDPAAVKEEMLKIYPAKTRKKRSKQIVPNNPETPPEIGANTRTIPGIISQRGCTYAGCRGVVMGPIYDLLQITHGPIGCGFYAWMTRRNLARPQPGHVNYMQYCMSTDMQEDQIIFGGEKKLKQAIKEAYEIFKPKAIAILATCPVGLIGDDIHTVARQMKEELGINVMAFSCEGYKGVSQSAGHHIANNGVFKNIIGLDDNADQAEFTMNILGEYNIGGDAWEIDALLRKCGIHLTATLSGDVTYDQVKRAHTVQLNGVMCHRSINYIADMMEKKFGIPWIKVNFLGAEATKKTLRKIARYFDSQKLADRVEEVIAQEMLALKPVQDEIRARCQGKTAALFVGGSRAHHYQDLFSDIGMETVSAGYEFAHRDDYEGRRVLPSIKVDADSRNIEELHVEPDPERFEPRKAPEQVEALKAGGFTFSDYEGMMAEMKQNALIIDDISHHEIEKLIEIYKPDIVGSGIKDKFVIEKMGVPCKQLHSYDYSGPYAAFTGAANFYREVDRMVNTKIWRHITPSWEKDPQSAAPLIHTSKVNSAKNNSEAKSWRKPAVPADGSI
ncbi:MAG: nitrogenase molybdenum-iron protein alpha chain [Candidatus Binataceae bacterium]|jgi:nitrogenase molybdenum-iron protein alpha chain